MQPVFILSAAPPRNTLTIPPKTAAGALRRAPRYPAYPTRK